MGLLDYEGLVCGWCGSTDIGMIPLATVSVKGPALVFPIAYCRDCGAPFVPPEGVIEEKREEWGDAIRKESRSTRIKKKAPTTKEPPTPDKKEKKDDKPTCEKCGKKMSVDHTSKARYTTFVLWKCRCGHTWLEKRHYGPPLSESESERDPEPLDPESFPEVDEDLS